MVKIMIRGLQDKKSLAQPSQAWSVCRKGQFYFPPSISISSTLISVAFRFSPADVS